jgi:hypothetical protein
VSLPLKVFSIQYQSEYISQNTISNIPVIPTITTMSSTSTLTVCLKKPNLEAYPCSVMHYRLLKIVLICVFAAERSSFWSQHCLRVQLPAFHCGADSTCRYSISQSRDGKTKCSFTPHKSKPGRLTFHARNSLQ